MALKESLRAAAKLIREAEFLLVTAGAGIGIDSGLPDYRGAQGLYEAFPPAKRANVTSFAQLANPEWFFSDPTFAWGFYGYRQNLYRETKPHEGFEVLADWIRERDGFVFTSNVDGAFQKAGIDKDRIVECHGSLQHLQCCHPSSCRGSRYAERIWKAEEVDCRVEIDPKSFHANEASIPKCPCGIGDNYILRPNILLFGDSHWISDRSDQQSQRFHQWAKRVRNRSNTQSVVVLEIGAGTAVPTVRLTSEAVAGGARPNSSLIRINPSHTYIPQGFPLPPSRAFSIPMGALQAINSLKNELESS